MLRSYVSELSEDAESASDVFQEVILRLLSEHTGPEELAEFAEHSRRVALEVAKGTWRGSSELPLDEEPLDPWLDPERAVDTRESLQRAIHHLGDDALELLVRRYILGENARELANGRSQSPAALRVRLMRLRSSARAVR
jgi:DNA-directed RNA polymerase specialized sigma24 family protein